MTTPLRVLIDATQAIAACERVFAHWAAYHQGTPAAVERVYTYIRALEALRDAAQAAAPEGTE